MEKVASQDNQRVGAPRGHTPHSLHLGFHPVPRDRRTDTSDHSTGRTSMRAACPPRALRLTTTRPRLRSNASTLSVVWTSCALHCTLLCQNGNFANEGPKPVNAALCSTLQDFLH